ncbi:hypothetical protein NDA11_000222 [Ustilago hordei]|uniref:Uncharacterized protein n=1 Tax=Ustilago hordei TaxID=120017 RepID=I2G0J5_USTHO|nr:uncharacterized protein UHO2_03510 [Ustilago hordei]KAJ1044293.1 hypothetical protein NDA10_003613 [Ustilago hordei]KAJ1578954.1 hypothetical protein NDA15_002871 [Ustilago hordei]KAJ1580767.1 hypothetical protein NDA12_006079 [Ustilago hordei]KAJ1581290.1 hypothetical protein NDA11_000222 [Ustilago hordei]KAJ1594944.1 hypothetical protein NDA14_003730 [Ustilago hordei]
MLTADPGRIHDITFTHADVDEICHRAVSTTDLSELYCKPYNLPDSLIPALPSYESMGLPASCTFRPMTPGRFRLTALNTLFRGYVAHPKNLLGVLYDAVSHISTSVCSAACCLMVSDGIWTTIRLSPADERGTGLQVLKNTAYSERQDHKC